MQLGINPVFYTQHSTPTKVALFDDKPIIALSARLQSMVVTAGDLLEYRVWGCVEVVCELFAHSQDATIDADGCLLVADGNLYGFGSNSQHQMFTQGDDSVSVAGDDADTSATYYNAASATSACVSQCYIRLLVNKTTSGKGPISAVAIGLYHSVILADGEW